ncbi:MAG: DUF167 domain-containing protein [Patescibacteria group bacterium]
MKIFVKAKPNAKEEKVQKIDDSHYLVSIKEPPIRGEANRAIIRVLSEYFKTTPPRVSIVSGYTARQKIIEIL